MRDPPGLNGRYGLASKQGDLLMEACRWQVFFFFSCVSGGSSSVSNFSYYLMFTLGRRVQIDENQDLHDLLRDSPG